MDEFDMLAYFLEATDKSLWVTPNFLGNKLGERLKETCRTFKPKETSVVFVSLDDVIEKLTAVRGRVKQSRRTKGRTESLEVLDEIIAHFRAFSSDYKATGGANFDIASFDDELEAECEFGQSIDDAIDSEADIGSFFEDHDQAA